MGNLQSILGDCQIGQLPVYLQQFVAQEGGGDEAYVVYGSKRMFQGQGVDSSGIRDDDEDDRVGMLNNSSDLYYSGPSQKHVRANMIDKKEKERRQVLVDIVDLCVDGIDSVELANRRAAKGSREPGGQTYTSPEGKGDTYLNSEVWDEAEYRAHENGVMRVVPGKEKSREKSKGSSSKKSKKEKKTKKNKKTLVEIEPDEASAPAVDDRVNGEEDLGYVSDSKNSVDGMTTPPQMGTSSPPRSPVSLAQASLKVYRQEESKLLEKMTVVVHPSEEPDSPPSKWCLLEAGWFRDWSAFLRGAPRPGQIKNAKLLNGNEPWPGLLPGKNYVGLDESTWKLLKTLYHADVEIIRPKFDIYSS